MCPQDRRGEAAPARDPKAPDQGKGMPQLKHFAVGQKENKKCFAVESSEHGIQSQSSPAVTADYVQSVCQI